MFRQFLSPGSQRKSVCRFLLVIFLLANQFTNVPLHSQAQEDAAEKRFYGSDIIAPGIPLKRELRRVRPNRIPHIFFELSSIVFEGIVLKQLAQDSKGHPQWLVKPEKIFFGADQVSDNPLVLISPTLKYGGVLLAVGQRYRICAVDLMTFGKGPNPKFSIWDGSVIPLTSSKRTRNKRMPGDAAGCAETKK